MTEAASQDTQPQTLAGGRYILVEPIGEGGMATVYRGFDQRLNVWRAIKVLSPKYAKSRKVQARFDGEAQTMALLDHRNIVNVYDVGSIGDISYIVMELVEGGTLVDWLERYGAMPPRLAIAATIQLCDGIEAAHAKGVIHRDIKPHNVLVTTAGVCRVTDFGIARVGDGDRSLTKTGTVMGTWGFMAPEQRSDAKNVDERGDIYAIAATLYTLVTNRIPMDLFAADRDKSVMSGVPEALYDVLIKATDYHKDARYQTVAELRDALAEVREALSPDPVNTPALNVHEASDRPAPSPEMIAKATPILPADGVPVPNPTIAPGNTEAGTTGVSSDDTPRPLPGPAATDPNTFADGPAWTTEPPRRSGGGLKWVIPIVVLLLGLGLFGIAGVILVPVLLATGGTTDTATTALNGEDTGGAGALSGTADPTAGDTDAPADTDAPSGTTEPPSARDTGTTRPHGGGTGTGQGTAEGGTPTARDTGTTSSETGLSEGTGSSGDTGATGDTGAATEPPEGTSAPEGGDTGEGTADAGTTPNVGIVETPRECVKVTPPSPPRVGTAANFAAALCSGSNDQRVTLWYRPAGTGGSWQSVSMPFRLGQYRTRVNVDERFSGGVEYYIETDGATSGSRQSPARLAVQ